MKPPVARVYAYVVSIATIAALLYPLTVDPWKGDSFPLSTYPMFSRRMTKPLLTLRYVIGIDADGTRHHLPPKIVVNEEVLQARATLRRLRSKAQMAALCEQMASRVRDHGGNLSDVAEIRIVTGTHDAIEFLSGRDRLGRERIDFSCRMDEQK